MKAIGRRVEVEGPSASSSYYGVIDFWCILHSSFARFTWLDWIGTMQFSLLAVLVPDLSMQQQAAAAEQT